ncbi:hypothetical protein OOK31_34210 [Streptomyces sp. NBC_00249]|nr:hypothetical protein [Streptomyces sp. NBC_00249]MCX5198883.1 hypothetical protein [Streptomyces sp. NBC_00249]
MVVVGGEHRETGHPADTTNGVHAAPERLPDREAAKDADGPDPARVP